MAAFTRAIRDLLDKSGLRVQGRASVRTDDLLAVRVPARAEDCRRLLDLLAAQEAEIQRLSARLTDGEAEVDTLVAELYGLDREAMEVVEEFLGRFWRPSPLTPACLAAGTPSPLSHTWEGGEG